MSKEEQNNKMETKPEIYTRDFVAGEVKEMLGEVRGNKEMIYVGQLFESRPYSRQRFSEWRKKFESDSEISDTICRIEELFETRINVGGLKNELNHSMTKFNLINNYNWREKTETDLTTKGESLNQMSYERAKTIITKGERSDQGNSAE